ncbi:hypothetical protein FQN57_001649 [Myotisia sp. PD_48]|nr:hypothetical protein FQN57_001649 [Myotisia sp. PD_48]
MAPSNVEEQRKPTLEERASMFVNRVTLNSFNGWDKEVLRGMKVISAQPGRTEFEFTVTDAMCNPNGMLHGGCSATILDILSTTALYTADGEKGDLRRSLSRTLSLTYLRPIAPGTRVRVVNKLVHAGKSLTSLSARIQTLDGKVCVTCVHDKAMLAPRL